MLDGFRKMWKGSGKPFLRMPSLMEILQNIRISALAFSIVFVLECDSHGEQKSC